MDQRLLCHSESSDPTAASVRVDAEARADTTVDPQLYGKFCEHLGRNIYDGMDAQILLNPTFGHWPFSAGTHHPDGGAIPEQDEDRVLARIEEYCAEWDLPHARALWSAYFDGAAFGWLPFDADGELVLSPDTGPAGDRAQRLTLREAGRNGVVQYTYLPLHRTRTVEYRLRARASGGEDVRLAIHRIEGGADPASPTDPIEAGEVLASATLSIGDDWTTVEGALEFPDDADPAVADDELLAVSVTADGPTDLVVDRVLAYPDDHVDRADPEVVEYLADAAPPVLRWPGGNFVSGYRWRDGVGPLGERPTTTNPAWGGVESNLFGTDEFLAVCERIGAEPLICVNAGDGTLEEAARWVEYCNGDPEETEMGRLRAEHGHPEPYGVELWEIGNETFGTWQVGWTTPEGNADRFRRFRDAMTAVDPSIEVSAVGNRNSPDDRWNDELIERAGGELRTITDHVLSGGTVDSGTDPDELFEACMAYADQLGEEYADLRDRMRAAGIEEPRLAITELQLFTHFEENREIETHGGELSPDRMPTRTTVSEALYHATVVHESIRLGEFVELLTHSATVNHGGGLQKHRGRTWADPAYYGRKMGLSMAGGTPVGIDLECATISTDRSFGDIEAADGVPAIDAMAVRSADDGDLVVTLVNRASGADPVDTTIDVEGAKIGGDADVTTLSAGEMNVENTYDDPERVTPTTSTLAIEDGSCEFALEPYSLVRLRIPVAD